jgi:hypothetical protein
MDRRTMLQGMGAGAMVSALAGMPRLAQAEMGLASDETGQPAGAGPVFELRIYHTYEGKLDGLLARFRDHTMTIFKRHGIESVAYWVPTDEPLKDKTLFYILKHPSREAATANWAAFSADPEWKQVSAASQVNGKLVEKTESTFMTLTDFSPKV